MSEKLDRALRMLAETGGYQLYRTAPGADAGKIPRGMGRLSPYEQPIPGEIDPPPPMDTELERLNRWQTMTDILRRSHFEGEMAKRRNRRNEKSKRGAADSPSS